MYILFKLKENVILALSQNQDSIPYRNSHLTRILQESFSGDCRTSLIATISPHSSRHEDQVRTLKFATLVKKIKKKVKIHEQISSDQIQLIEQLQTELENEKNKYNKLRGVVQNLKDQIKSVDYWKGELPLDLFLENSYDNGQKTNTDALTVYLPTVDPILYEMKNFDTYRHFDEKSYDYAMSIKTGKKREMLENLNTNDGFLGYYSKNSRKEVLKMLVCVTMYSESRLFLEQTLFHIFRNLKGFENIGLQDFQIVVVVIQDGIMKMKEETVDFYCEMEGENRDVNRNLKLRRYEIQKQMDYLKFKNQESILDANEGLPPTIPKRIALVYQNRLQFVKNLDSDKQEKPKVLSSNNFGYLPEKTGLTVLSVFKHINAKKLSSHMWFFEGFCRQFRPKYCALVDVGTLPAQDGLVKFYIALESNKRIGGVCGFLGLEDPIEYNKEKDKKKDKNSVTEPSSELERILKERHSNYETKVRWWKQWQLQKKAEEKKPIIEQELQEQHDFACDKIALNKAKEDYQCKKYWNQTILSYVFFLPIKMPLLIIKFLYFIIVECAFSFIVKALKWITLNYLDTFANLKKAQMYEYTMAHMLDKNFESLLGFLHVLPGAWSAYRYEALEIQYSHKQNLLQKKYFKQLINSSSLEGTIQEANMFLAEDRILCLGIYCQPNSDYILKFIPDARAYTDPVDTLEEFMNQRRRWINSTLYALDYVIKHHVYHVKESNHGYFTKNVLLPFNMFFAKIGEINTYFIPAFYFFVAFTCSFQMLIPTIIDGYLKKQNNSINSDNKCLSGYQLKVTDRICDAMKSGDYDCWEKCSDKNFSKLVFTMLDAIPVVYIICFLLIVFASLTFRIKRVDAHAVKQKLQRSLLTSVQEAQIVKREQLISDKINYLKDKTNRTHSQIKKDKKIIEKERISFEKQICKLSEQAYNATLKRINMNAVQLTQKEKQFKNQYDSAHSQEYANNSFKILAAIISIVSLIVMVIILLAIIINIFDSKYGLKNGFVLLDNWLRFYIIVMVVINGGAFFLLIFVHLLFQPQLVWDIITSYSSYIIYQPVYNFILIIFSFCNIDDVTWGTKGISSSSSSQYFYEQKVKFLVKWFSANAILLLIMIGGNIFSGKTPYTVLIIGLYGTGYLAIKSVLAVANYIKYFLVDKWRALYKIQKAKQQNNQKQEELSKDYKNFIQKIDEAKTKIQQELEDIYRIDV